MDPPRGLFKGRPLAIGRPVSYPALKGGASCFTAPPCPWPRAMGRGRSST
jgi:hypothetical protein